jgi:hypothetical protein
VHLLLQQQLLQLVHQLIPTQYNFIIIILNY